MACATILGCTSAVKLDNEIAVEATAQGNWPIGQEAFKYIKDIDVYNRFGFTGALGMCIERRGFAEVCERLESDVIDHMSIMDYAEGNMNAAGTLI